MNLVANEALHVYGCEIMQSDLARYRRHWLKHWPDREIDDWIMYRTNIYRLTNGAWIYGVDLYGLSAHHIALAQDYFDMWLPDDCVKPSVVVAMGHMD